MSARSRRLVFTSNARSDIRNVLVFTEQQWGKPQRRTYERLISESIAKIARFPHLGRFRPEYGPDFQSLRVRQHVIVYQVTDTKISIIRDLHIRRDADGAFEVESS